MSDQIPALLTSLAGGVVGGAVAIFGQWFMHRYRTREQRQLDQQRRAYLRTMLDTDGWRQLSTLARVIGATEDDTRRLLIEIGARGSERDNDVWALIARKPFPSA